MASFSGYGQWLRQRVSSGLNRLENSSAGGTKWMTMSACALSALLILMAFVTSNGGALIQHNYANRDSSQVVTGAGSIPRIDRRIKEKPAPVPDPESEQWANTVAICAMVSNPHLDDLLEWLQYHKWLGVDKIYLRENESIVFKRNAATFQDMVDDGFLDIGEWAGEQPESTQLWMNRCSAGDMAGSFSWIMFNDLDQYIVLLDEGVAVKDPDLKGFLSKRRKVSGLAVHRILFGSNGYDKRPSPGGPLKHYTKCKDLFSFPSKCMASTYHMCPTPFTDSDDLDACAYKATRGPKKGYEVDVEYGDSTPPWDMQWALVDTKSARNAQEHLEEDTDEKCVAYERKLHDPGFGHSPRHVAKGEALVLFHYVTRSYEEFLFREPKLPGVYSQMFRDRWEESRDAFATANGVKSIDEFVSGVEAKLNETEQQAVARGEFDNFEDRHRFNLEGPEHAVCSSLVEADYLSRCCGGNSAAVAGA